ncbi:MAG: Asp-tRNA(Asn)/Glu-tRNA(Gln) amidotransferase subunit GatA [Luteitalea sp.]|nr:Asp-tRNA(Asn)/Glu-tRNA(Gln) amidotransferase subunit GatA [Luteitalea sp.]
MRRTLSEAPASSGSPESSVDKDSGQGVRGQAQPDSGPTTWTAEELRSAVVRGDVSATEVCQASLERITEVNQTLNAFTTVDADAALAQAAALDRDRTALAKLPLAGVPIAIKDNLCTRGLATTACSRILTGFVPPYDATVVARLRAAGAVIIGKTNCDEFAMGSSTENSALGPTRNPWALDRTPGGSSGGSAAAVAARLVPFALGSETGGSVRQPAAMCGIVGLKPTYGRISRYGLLAFGSSLDQVAPLTRVVRDAALLMGTLAGADPRDATSASEPVPDYVAALTGNIRGLRIGVPRRLLETGVDPEVTARFDAAVAALRDLGASVTDVELPHARYAIPVYYLVATAEASSNLARYDGVRYGYRAPTDEHDGLTKMYSRTRDTGFGAEVKRRIMLGTYVLSAGYYDAYYLKAQQVRTLIRRDYEQAFDTLNVLVLPTSPTPAFRLGERVNDPLQMYLADVFTVSANLAGIPGVSVPCGFTRDRLPVGLQILGRPFDEATVLRVGDAYERAFMQQREEPGSLSRSDRRG